MITYRPMHLEDVRKVAELERKNFSLPWTEDAIKDGLQNKNNLFFVAESEKHEIAGYCMNVCALDEAEIVSVCVAEDYRKRHIGSEMMTYMLENSVSAGIRAFFLEVRESNIAAQTLYTHLGFEKVGIRKNFYERPVENGIVMTKLYE